MFLVTKLRMFNPTFWLCSPIEFIEADWDVVVLV